MGKERSPWTLKCLGVFFWLVTAAYAQAAVFTVNTNVDLPDASPGNGVCDAVPPNNICTLRAAIEEANALPGADQINLSPNTYLLTIVTDVVITGNLTMSGSGASTTIIDGNKSVRPNSRVLVAGSGITVHISGATIRNGGTGDNGGGIFNVGTMTLTNSTVSGNNAGVDGGGILNSAGGTMTLTNSTVSGNNAGDDAGGVFNVSGGTMTLINSTVSGNSCGDGGGGIRNSGTMTLINSTVSGNNAGGNGGGIYMFSGTANSFNSTITDNRSDAGLSGTGVGGGVHNDAAATFTFQNTILAGNFESQRVGNFFVATVGECDGTIISSGNNLMEHYDTSHCTVIGNPLLADPKLSPLQNNGGPTKTHALLTGSPAIDAGNSLGCRDNLGALLATDQRGFLRPADGDGNGTARCDIGAYEAKAVTGPEAFVFQQYEDFLDREPDSGELAAWVNALNSGLPRASLIEAFMDSGEFRFEGKFIAQTYLGILTRDADVGGFEAWLGALLAGISREQIVQGFLVSGEFQSRFGSNLTNGQFVERMYNNILLRPSDPGGLNGWVQALNSGQLTRAQVALVFLDSGEFQSLSASQNRVDISLLYFDMLQRNPDAGGFSAWVGVLNAGVPLTSVIDVFLNSSEYQTRF